MKKIIVFFSVLFIALLTSCGVYGSEKYTITYYTNGGNGIPTVEADWGTEYSLQDATRKGYTFAGWYSDAELKNKVSVTSGSIAENITVYAKWTINQYKVTYMVDGVKYEEKTQDYNTTVTVEKPEKDDYTFDKWYSDQDCTKAFNNVIPAENTTVYAGWVANEMTITFDNNAADARGQMRNQTVTIDARQLNENAFVRDGYTFMGWALTPNGEVKYQDQGEVNPIEVNDAVVFYAVWQINKYPVNFIVDGIASDDSYTADMGSAIALPQTNPTKTGETFVGWYQYVLTTDTKFVGNKTYYVNENQDTFAPKAATVVAGADVSGEYYELVKFENGNIPLGGLNLYASFKKNEYKLHFDTNGGSVIADRDVEYQSSISAPATPEKEGHEFVGWYADEALTNLYTFTTMPSNDLTLYAKWNVLQYTLTIVLGNGQNNVVLKQNYGSNIAAQADPERTGYTFGGWSEAIPQTMPAQNKTITALWTPNTDTAYVVRHLQQNIKDDNYVLVDTDNLTGTTEQQTAGVAKNYEGFTSLDFVQKAIAADGSTIVEIRYNRNLYSVTFVDEDENAIVKIENVRYGDVIATLPNQLVRTGYEYTTVDFTTSTQITTNLVVVVKYEARKLNVKLYNYDKTLNDEVEDTIVAEFDSPVVLPSVLKTGYNFLGWFDKAEGEEGAVKVESGFLMPATPVDLYAHYEIVTYTLSYELNGGELDSEDTNPSEYNVNTNTFTLNNPTKLGYEFLGWTEEEVTTPNAEVTIAKGSTGNRSFVANWEVVVYDIMYNLDEGTNDPTNPSEYTIVSAAIVFANPSKEGYTFKGWVNAENQAVTGISAGSVGDVVVFATWEVNNYTLTINYKKANADNAKEQIPVPYNSSLSLVINAYQGNAENITTYFKFDGWDNLETNMPLGGLEITARYIEKAIVVRFVDSITNKQITSNEHPTTNNANTLFLEYVSDIYGKMVAYETINTYLEDLITYQGLRPVVKDQVIAAIAEAMSVPASYITEDTVIDENGTTVKDLIESNLQDLIGETAYQNGMLIGPMVLDTLGTYAYLRANSQPVTIEYVYTTVKSYPEAYKALITPFNAISEEIDYLLLIVVASQTENYEELKATTSAKALIEKTAYNGYRNNAYYPSHAETSYVFKEWAKQETSSEGVVTYLATYYKTLDRVQGIQTDTVTKTGASFSWDVVEGASKYVVSWKKNGEAQANKEVTTNSVTIEELEDKDVIELTVKAISDPESSPVKHNNAFEDDSVLSLESVPLNGQSSIEYSYKHVVIGEVNVSSSGEGYYVDKEASTLYLFTQSSYSFGSSTTITILEDEYNILSLSSDNLSLNTSSKNGTARVRIGDQERNVVVRLLPTELSVGDNLLEYNSITKNINNEEYRDKTVATYQVGTLRTSKYSNCDFSSTFTDEEKNKKTYYNGFSFQTIVNTSSSSTLNSTTFDLQYTFYKYNGETYELVPNPDALFIYDVDKDAFYFRAGSEDINLGLYKVVISYKRDNAQENYVNISLPNMYKEEGKEDRTDKLTKEFYFELNNGYNVYTNEALKTAFSDLNAENINLHSNIKVELNPNQVGYVPYNQYWKEHGYGVEARSAVDIKDRSAVMSESATPRIWKEATGTDEVIFTSKDGKKWAYAGPTVNGGTHGIESAEWVQNFSTGLFTINNDRSPMLAVYNTLGMNVGTLYQRYNNSKDPSVKNLTLNGNYFTVDGSELPFIHAEGSNSAGDFAAAYEIQQVGLELFSNSSNATVTYNNMTVISNTFDASSWFAKNSDSSIDIKEYMQMTSGGFNAFYTNPSNQEHSQTAGMSTKSASVFNNVIVSNALIAIYCDYGATCELNNSIIRNSWANSYYAYGGKDVVFHNTLIETCGGGATHIDEYYYTYTNENPTNITNSQIHYGDSAVLINNPISGEEQWFKAYAMEVMALGLKSQVEALMNQQGYTILKEVVDASGRLSEKMNVVFLGKNNPIEKQQEKVNNASDKAAAAADLVPELVFSNVYTEMPLGDGRKMIVTTDGHYYFWLQYGMGEFDLFVVLEAYKK